MPTTVNVSNVKAADPGFGFDLQISNNGGPLNDTLRIIVTINSAYSTEISIKNPVIDQTLSFVVPFGDNQYTASRTLSFQIDAYVPGTSTQPTQSMTGTVMSDSGKFKFSSDMITALAEGQSLGPNGLIQSIDSNYIGIMQTDGNFCVYTQYNTGSDPLKNTDSSGSDYGSPNCSLLVKSGRIFVFNNDTQANISASLPSQAMPGASMVIDTNGHICLMLPGGKPIQVALSPGFV